MDIKRTPERVYTVEPPLPAPTITTPQQPAAPAPIAPTPVPVGAPAH